MKKILVIIIILLSSNGLAHIDHYKKYNKIEMDIFRNGELIGYNYYFFKRNGDETIVTNQIKFSVKVLGATIFQVEGYGEEKNTNKFYIKGYSYSGKTSSNNIVGNWWSHKILQTDTQISPISGSVKEQVVTFIGREKIEQYGKVYNVDRFTIKSKDTTLPQDKKLDFNVWYEPGSAQIIRVSYSRMGNWEYRLKHFE